MTGNGFPPASPVLETFSKHISPSKVGPFQSCLLCNVSVGLSRHISLEGLLPGKASESVSGKNTCKSIASEHFSTSHPNLILFCGPTSYTTTTTAKTFMSIFQPTTLANVWTLCFLKPLCWELDSCAPLPVRASFNLLAKLRHRARCSPGIATHLLLGGKSPGDSFGAEAPKIKNRNSGN